MKKSGKKCYKSTGTKFLAHKMSQNMDSGTGSQLSKYNTICWRWKTITSQLLMLLIRWTLEQPSEHLWHTVPHRSRHSCCACKSGVRWTGVFCVRPAYCCSQKQNDQVNANASLFETEQKSIGEHRHQCLCVNVGTLTLMEMNCK